MSGPDWLVLAWAALIGLAILLYVVLDGIDLGIGILLPGTREDGERDQMIASIAPFWDGNETWLVLGGAGLFVAFPPAYAVVMPALYMPVIVMLLALIFRGVAFEFRHEAAGRHRRWDISFFAGSLIAAFAQGVILGGVVQGITVVDGAFAGGGLDWLSPFALACGAGLAAGYALLGAAWLVMKTTGPVRERARAQARAALVGTLAFIALISLWTPLKFPDIAARWFATPNLFYLAPVPVVTALAALAAWRGLARGGRYVPLFGAASLFVLGFVGLAVSFYPYLVPPSLTIWQAAAAPSSQLFSFVGAAIMLPIVLGYTAFVHYTFRGTVEPGDKTY